MAKISARGAHEIARITAYLTSADTTYIWMMTSDGRILARMNRVNGRSYSGPYKLKHRLGSLPKDPQRFLENVVKISGYTIV